ncbi:hypothetical protein EW146_g7577 [Bondarzewia mesenterica]|uniref:Protein YOP1 n=1 Tax=Bondarzewia mesenterica TaxID=1095465 RepID=A0A4S4LKD7_9AGAM|nr:hypothetical protein EW146_g7577 [Bondarzewia mesenterica]
MFLLYFTSRIVSSVAAFLYPGYASFKTLSQRPASEEDLERWLMYWSVLGCIVGVEYVAEWIVSWIPLYYPIKTLFLLYLALPQTRGSSYLYQTHLRPFLSTYESQIDAALASLKTKIYAFVSARARALWEQISRSMGQPGTGTGVAESSSAAAAPTLGDPVSGPTQMLGSLWRTYGPAIVASGAALLRQGAVASASETERALGEGEGDTVGRRSPANLNRQKQAVLERKRRLEAELAALSVEGYDVGGESVEGSASASSKGEERGRFEEVEVPSDVEDAGGVGEPAPPVAQKRSSWFGWGGAASQGYERVKTE